MPEKSPKTQVVYFTRLHWVIFLAPVAMLAVFVGLVLYLEPLKPIGIYLVIFALLWILMTVVTYYFSSITIQRKQVILRTGLLVRQTVDIPLGKIETIDIRQSIIGSLFKFGTLIIVGTGGTRYSVNYLCKPLTCRRYIEQLMNELQ